MGISRQRRHSTTALVIRSVLLMMASLAAACARPQAHMGSVEIPTATPVAAAITPHTDATPPPDNPMQDAAATTMRSYLTSLTDNGQFMGGVLVAKDSALILAEGFGLADTEAKVPAAPEQRYRIGSITKQFTAAAILRLQERGQIDLNAPISAYLPEYPNADRITIHQLLTHTSGIPDYERLPIYLQTINQPATTAQLVARFSQLPLQFAPGTRFAYSSSNYILLTQIIEEVSGKSYGQFLHDEFFSPLYLTHTGLDAGDLTAADRARGYIPTAGQLGPARPIDMSIPSGAGALVSTVFDLYGWIQALQHGLALNPTSVTQLFTPYVSMDSPPGAPPAEYGYGWVIDQHLGQVRFWHPGHIFGFAATLAVYPDEDATIVVLSNIEGADVRRIQEELARILFDVR